MNMRVKEPHEPCRSGSLPAVILLLFPILAILCTPPAPAAGAAAGSESSSSPGISSPSIPTPLDLKTAQRIALVTNPSLQAAQARVAQARERVRQAWSRYLPRVEGSASAAHVRYPRNQGSSLSASSFSSLSLGLIPGGREDVYTAAVNATVTLFDGFQREFALAASRSSEIGSRAAYREAQRLLLAAVADAYFNAQLSRERITIAEADEAFNLRQLKDAQAREALGAGSLSDVLNFQVQVNLARSQRIQAEQEYRVALSGLAALMGLPEGAFPDGTSLAPLAEPDPSLFARPSVAEAVTYALGQRPDLVQARSAVRAAQAGVGSAKSRFSPSVNLFGTLEGSRTHDGRLEQDDFGSSVGIALVVPLFSGGEDFFRVREAQESKREAERNADKAAVEAASQVRTAIEQILGAQEQYRLQRENAAWVHQNRDLVEKEYSAGQTSLVRLTQAQRDLVQAQSQLALARISLENAWIRLHAATGRLLEDF